MLTLLLSMIIMLFRDFGGGNRGIFVDLIQARSYS